MAGNYFEFYSDSDFVHNCFSFMQNGCITNERFFIDTGVTTLISQSSFCLPCADEIKG